MKIAIIGSGISGLVAAYLLDQKYDVSVFEANDYIGGHTHTVPVIENGQTIWIDTGFIVCNPKNYLNFFKLLKTLNVPLQKSDMSFSVSVQKNGLEYNGTSFNGIFAQRTNILNLKFWKLLKDIMTFNTAAKKFVSVGNQLITLKEFIDDLQLSAYFTSYYLIPMIAAIWSSEHLAAFEIPAVFICRFLDNHGMLNINDRPQWYTVQGGSHEYIKALVNKLKNKVRLNTAVTSIIRNNNGIEVHHNGGIEHFDKVIIATHSDQALKILQNPSQQEHEILSGMRYQNNEVVLHTDISLLPKQHRAWASWNYKLMTGQAIGACVTYNMNILQNLTSKTIYCVSLNQTMHIDASKIINKFQYAHPIFDKAMLNSQSRYTEISGVNNTYYCGAYWGNGFHEDGINSALAVVAIIDKDLLCEAQFSLA
jgi:predicted NAD/FAD-binding protein